MKLLKIGKPLSMNGFILQVNDQEALELIASLSSQMQHNPKRGRREELDCELVGSSKSINKSIYFSIAVKNQTK